MARKNYTTREKEAYHTNRVNNPHVSDEKKLYSQQWLRGFHDIHAKGNYSAVCTAISFRNPNRTQSEKIMLNAYKNGLKANLDSQKQK